MLIYLIVINAIHTIIVVGCLHGYCVITTIYIYIYEEEKEGGKEGRREGRKENKK